MYKKIITLVLMLLVPVAPSFADGGKDYQETMALAECADCAFTMSSDVIAFGNVGGHLLYSESQHIVSFFAGQDSVTAIEISFLVADSLAINYLFTVLFTDYDVLESSSEITSEGTWYSYQWIRNTPIVFDSTINLLSFRTITIQCSEVTDTLVVDLDSYAANGWGNQYSGPGIGIREPLPEDITDGYRTFYSPSVDLSAWDSDDTVTYSVDAGPVGGEVAVPIYLRELTFNNGDSTAFTIGYDSTGLNFSHFVPNLKYAANSNAVDGSGEVFIYTVNTSGVPVPVSDVIMGTAYFDIDTSATVGSELDVWVKGVSYFEGCQIWYATCDNSSEKVFVDVSPDAATLKIQRRALCTTTVPGLFTLDVHILTNQSIATDENFASNLAFSFDKSLFSNMTFAGVTNVAYGGGTMSWQVAFDGDIITIQEHPQMTSPAITPSSSYQLIAKLKFNVGSSIGYDTVSIETSNTYTYAVTHFTDTVLTVSDGNLAVIDGWIQVKTCGGGGCPAVFSWNGDGFVMEDFVLTHSQKQSNPHADNDYLPLKSQLVPVNGQYSLQIREFENEKTYLDQVELIAADYPIGSNIGISESGEIMTHQKWLEPIAAIDQDGNDVLDFVGAEDGIKFVDEGEGSLKLTFTNPFAGKESARLGFLATGEDKPIEPPIRQLSDQGPDWNGVTAEIEDAGGNWHYLGNSVVRENGADGANWVFDDPNVSFGSEVAIRLSWVDGFEADIQRLLVDDGAAVTTHRIAPTVAEHSVLGKAIGSISSTDRDVLTLEPGETIDLRFTAPAPPTAGMVRAFFVKTHGYYETFGAGNLPTDYALNQNYPNPFNPTTTISFALPKSGEVRLAVYNLLGQEINTLVTGVMEAGAHEIVWEGTDRDGNSVASGVYFYRLTVGDYTASKKMTLVK